MKNLWLNLAYTYKLLISMLFFIMLIQLGTLVYIWQFKSKVLLKKERQNLSYQLDMKATRLLMHFESLKKQLTFLSTLEIMDDVLVNDIDKRIAILLDKKAKDLGENIILALFNHKHLITASRLNYNPKDFLTLSIPIYATFNTSKKVGTISLLYPFINLQQLKISNPHQRLWLRNFVDIRYPTPNHKDNIIVSKILDGIFINDKLFLSYEKKYAFESIKEIEKVLIFSFIISLSLLLIIVWVVSKKQINMLKHTQEVLELKRTFLSTMSHELRTPLGSILNLTQHLMVSPKIGDQEIEMLGRIENSSEHLLGMINDLLQLSKLDSNSMSVRAELVDISQIIEEMVEIVEPLIDEKELNLKKNLTITNTMIKTDVNLFKQIIINLLSNAIKFTEKGSISLNLSQKDNVYTFEVIDTGVGIEKEKQTALFTEFYQAHTQEVKHSTGLGLALSQKIAHLINGKLEINSEGLNKGTNASFIFHSC